jgi:hypothetical protein
MRTNITLARRRIEELETALETLQEANRFAATHGSIVPPDVHLRAYRKTEQRLVRARQYLEECEIERRETLLSTISRTLKERTGWWAPNVLRWARRAIELGIPPEKVELLGIQAARDFQARRKGRNSLKSIDEQRISEESAEFAYKKRLAHEAAWASDHSRRLADRLRSLPPGTAPISDPVYRAILEEQFPHGEKKVG